MVPTPLGLCLIEGFRKVDEELVLPSIRSMMEQEVTLPHGAAFLEGVETKGRSSYRKTDEYADPLM